MIKAVIFDLDNTLYDFDKHHGLVMGPLSTMASQKFGVNAEAFCQAYQDSMDEMFQNTPFLYSGLHSRTVRFGDICRRLDIPVIPTAADLAHMYWEILLMGITAEPHVIELLQSLRSLGIKVGLGTNMTAYVQYRKLEKIGITDEIEYFITSEESAYEKPEAGFFQYVIQKVDCKPEEILFVGDDMVNDILPALDAGMHALWYTRCLSTEKQKAFQELADQRGRKIQECISKLPNISDYEDDAILHISNYWNVL